MSRWRHHVKWWRHIKKQITQSCAGENFRKSHKRNFENRLWFRCYAAKSRPGGKFTPPPGSMCVNHSLPNPFTTLKTVRMHSMKTDRDKQAILFIDINILRDMSVGHFPTYSSPPTQSIVIKLWKHHRDLTDLIRILRSGAWEISKRAGKQMFPTSHRSVCWRNNIASALAFIIPTL